MIYYATKKRISEFIESKLKEYDSLESFRNDLEVSIKNSDETMKNQKHFFTKVLKHLG